MTRAARLVALVGALLVVPMAAGALPSTGGPASTVASSGPSAGTESVPDEPGPAARPGGAAAPEAAVSPGAPAEPSAPAATAAAAQHGPRPEDGSPAPLGANDWSCAPSAAHPRPVVLVHGLGATMAENWAYLSPILQSAGYCVFALTYGERPDFPYLGGILPMQESARELDAFVDRVLAATGAAQVDLVGHSEGTVMPQWWLKKLGGAARTHHYVALTPLYDGTTLFVVDLLVDQLLALFPEADAPGGFDNMCGSCRQFLAGSSFYEELYSDGTVAAPGVGYTTIMTRFDELVIPYSSGYLVGPDVENIVLQDVCPFDLSEHALVAFDPVVARMILNGLDPKHAVPVDCGGALGLGLGTLKL